MQSTIAEQLESLGFRASQDQAPPPDNIVRAFGGIYFHCPKCDNSDQRTLYVPSPKRRPWEWRCDYCGWTGPVNELNEVLH